MGAHPIVDRLDTRALERREVVRRVALSAEAVEARPDGLVLRTVDGETSVLTRWPEGTGPDAAQRAREREFAHGALRVDAVDDRVLRIRYAPRDAVPENPTQHARLWRLPEPLVPHHGLGRELRRCGRAARARGRLPRLLRLRRAAGRDPRPLRRADGPPARAAALELRLLAEPLLVPLRRGDRGGGRAPARVRRAGRRAARRHALVPARLVLRPRVRSRALPGSGGLDRAAREAGHQGVALAAPLRAGGVGILRRARRGGRLREDARGRSVRRRDLLRARLPGRRRLHRLHESGRAPRLRRAAARAPRARRPRHQADFGEQAPLDGVYHDGTPGHRAHNLYPLMYNQAVAETTAEATGEWIVWARSAWAGSQRYPLHWGGDPSANWANLGPQLAGGLSFGCSGFPFWSQDIGGFVGETGGPLLVRWLQAGLFLSHARIHGMGRRELPDFDADVLRIGREYLRLRYRLLPYLYGSALDCAARALPMMRALVLEWPDDPSTWRIDDQWLLGDALLVAPILDETGRRKAYLPAGTWTDWWSGARLAGPRWIDVEADLETLPLWMREGGLVPMGPAMRWVGERPTDAVELRLAPFAGDGESVFVAAVDDDERVTIRYVARGGAHRVEIGPSRAPWALAPIGDDAPAIEVVRVPA